MDKNIQSRLEKIAIAEINRDKAIEQSNLGKIQKRETSRLFFLK